MSQKDQYLAMAHAAASRFGLDPELFTRQINQESGFNPTAVSPAGALGIAQIMPHTAAGWGVDPMNPEAALNAAAKNMASYINTYKGQGHDDQTAAGLALAAYNAGPGNVAKYGGIPPFAETQRYVQKILGGGNVNLGKKPQAGK